MSLRTARAARSRRALTATMLTAATAAVGLAGAVPARAAPTVVVQCPADNLQTAIDSAAPGSTLFITGTCTGNFTIAKDLILSGLGATLDGGHSGTVVTVASGVRVKLARLTITHGLAISAGGGIRNDGTMTLTDSPVEDNSTATGVTGGGGIYNQGVMTLDRSTVTRNTTPGDGGGIHNQGTMTLYGSDVLRNEADHFGGGIYNDSQGTMWLFESAVARNSAAATGRPGGGIYNASTFGGSLLLDRVRVFDNEPDQCAPEGSVPGCTPNAGGGNGSGGWGGHG